MSFNLTQGLLWGHDLFGRPLPALLALALARSLGLAFGATLATWGVAVLLGAFFPLLSARGRGVVLWLQDLLLAFPSLLLSFAVAAVRGPSTETLLLALMIGGIPSLLRFTATQAEELFARESTLAARGLGASRWHLFLTHLLPGVAVPAAAQLPNAVVHAVLAEASLSFLGIGAPIGLDTLGSLLQQGREYLIEAPHIAWSAGIPLLGTVLSLGALSDTLLRKWQISR